MLIDINAVSYISKLAKLRFTEEETEKLAKEFQSILSHFESIDKFDLSETATNTFSMNLESVLRKDEVTYFEDKEKLFSNVKSMSGSSIKVPRIIE